MNNTNGAMARLASLGLSVEEAKAYLELLSGPSTHLQLSRATGINRTKMYRLAEQLERRSLIGRRTDDRGTFLVAADPETLKVALIAQEEKIKRQRQVLDSLIPQLSQLRGKDSRLFVVRTYEGEAGLKQMLWHELKTKGELLALGNGSIEQISSDERWANRHRDHQITAGYKSRELINYDYSTDVLPELAGEKLLNSKLYSYRMLSPDILTFDSQTIIYNDTVAICHWKHDQKVGVEIISPTYAQMMRHVFEHYWNLAAAESGLRKQQS